MFGLQASGAAASWMVGRMGTDAHLYDDPDDASIPALLDSRFDADKVNALKRLLAHIAQGVDVSHLFPQVVKNVASQSLEVKKLVYLYLLHYADKRQNEALLSINIFQKDLSDINPLVRAWALRTMAGIRLHVVAPLVLVAIKKCARDPSAYVRKCAAYALCKLCDLLPDERTPLEEIVDVLFGDNSPGVVGAAAVAFKSVCPSSLVLIAKHFRRLCETLPDIEEWTQVILIEILLRYVIARHGLVKDSTLFPSNLSMEIQGIRDSGPVDSMSTQLDTIGKEVCGTISNITLFRHYIEEYSGFLGREDSNLSFSCVTTNNNDDVAILLKCTSPLLWSRNTGIILAAASVHWIMAPVEELKRIVGPILFTLRSSHDAAYVMLGNILVFAKTMPSLFAPFYEDFFINASDSYQTRALKLEILTTIATEPSLPAIFEEFQDYIKDPDRKFVADTIAAIALCAQKLPSIASICLEGLLALVFYESSFSDSVHFDGEDAVLVHAILSIKAIVKMDPVSHEKVIIRLVRSLEKIKEPTARSLIIWMFGEYSSTGDLIPKMVPAVLKYLAWSFAADVVETKLQILNASAKVIIHSPEKHMEEFKRIVAYVIELATCDLSYDVRDRARLLSRLLPCYTTHLGSSCQPQNGDICKELADHIFDRKFQPTSHSARNYRIYLPGSLSQVVLHAAPGYAPLPKPQSMELIHGTKEPTRDIADSSRSNNSDAESGSSTYESSSVYDSESEVASLSDRDAVGSNNSNEDDHNLQRREGNQDAPLVHIYDASVEQGQTSQNAEENLAALISTDLTELMSKSALESWLHEAPAEPLVQDSTRTSFARVSFTDRSFERKPKLHVLLDSSDSNGLSVLYAFSSEVSRRSRLLLCMDLYFENVTTHQLKDITIKSEEASSSEDGVDQTSEGSASIPTIVPAEEIHLLAPQQMVKMVLQVHFHHHLLPLKLFVLCNGKRHPAKLYPDIAYFVRPLPMDLNAFLCKENQLRGMFEYARRCTFKDHLQKLEHTEGAEHTDKNLLLAQSLASKILSNTNVHLVSMDMPVTFSVDDASGLCWRFSSEIQSTSNPCLITIVAEGHISGPLDLTAKVNCEDTSFALNLLNRVVAIIE
ncbi:AP3-complex subunit beta-A-like isoform X2 [Phragmites australis]|uniref:AP3-complex subunit beta-A-like isoform X2 n=1 Tax=Phragmites australis TaxID=29695 RepID=UPI002D767579|nr:AP3-complex subunit beta-A-like isoform X2 [Phragmites australis]